jgi:hypothetical protein
VRRNGETNPVTVVLVLALAGAGFYVYHVAPVYMDNMEAKEAATECFNTYWSDGPEVARNRLLNRLNGAKSGTSHLTTDENGVEVVVPGLGLENEQVTIVLQPETRKLTVRIEYERTIRFAPLKKYKKFHLVAEKVGTQLK